MRELTFGLCRMRGISRLAVGLLQSQEASHSHGPHICI